jgi:hypothetical protein
MLLSILMPSHRDDLMAYSRIAQACSWANDNVEIVVRDNSGKPAKKSAIERFHGGTRRMVFVDECDSKTNFMEALALARGDFVFFISDDDLCFDRGIAAVAAAAAKFSADPAVAGITGLFALEEHQGSQIVRYPNMESSDALTRIFGYLGYQGPNLFFYTPVRRQVALACWTFMEGHPFAFPFHDQVLALLYLLSGRFIDIGRLMIVYDNMNWDTAHKAQDTDTRLYSATGMDPAFGHLHWLVCGFEGARLLLASSYGAQLAAEQRQSAANRWFEVMFARFATDVRTIGGSELVSHAQALCQKWRQPRPQFELDALLADICGFMERFSSQKAGQYRDFWASLAAQTNPALTRP